MKLISSHNKKFQIFSKLIQLEFDFSDFSLSEIPVNEFIPPTVKSLKIFYLKNPADYPEIFTLPQLESIELEFTNGSLPPSFGSNFDSGGSLKFLTLSF